MTLKKPTETTDADASASVAEKQKQGAADSGRYFRYMAEFVGFTADDAAVIQQTKPVIENHLADIVEAFYAHLLRYPPTRSLFLKKDGSLDKDYLELRMRHLTNFWLRTASGVYDDDYARFVDYVGRAHTSHGADPTIYVAERYVIGQVGFVQHAISEVLAKELRPTDSAFAHRAEEAWDKLMMVILEMLSRAYGNERSAESFDPLVPVDEQMVKRLAEEALREITAGASGAASETARENVVVGKAGDVPEGERKIVCIRDVLSIGVFHHEGKWVALKNSCLHRGGPVATGCLEGEIITCPWHGLQYNITTGQMLDDANAALEMFPVTIRDGEILLSVPVAEVESAPTEQPTLPGDKPALKENEFRVSDLTPGKSILAKVDGAAVAVFNCDGAFHATQNACTHAGGPLNEGTSTHCVVECPWHGSQFDVTDGKVVRGPARKPLQTYSVKIDGDIGRVTPLEK
jgi:nitrite reductase/ring-hydroxylating ferredoxin subunit/hemoglobin-like flavoprotein